MIDPKLEDDLINDSGPEGTLAAVLISYLDDPGTAYHTLSITILNDAGYEEVRVDVRDAFGGYYELSVKRVNKPSHMQD